MVLELPTRIESTRCTSRLIINKITSNKKNYSLSFSFLSRRYIYRHRLDAIGYNSIYYILVFLKYEHIEEDQSNS